MMAVDYEAYARRRKETSDLKKENDELRRLNSELAEKVNDIYGAYEMLEYTFSGRCRVYSTEILRLREEIERLKMELRARGWEEE